MHTLQKHRLALLWNAIAVAPLLVYAYNTVYIRFMFDDFCWHNDALIYGSFGLVSRNYQGWSGRFTSEFFFGLVAYIPEHLAPLFATAFLAVWWLAVFMLARLILRRRGIERAGAFAGVAASLLVLTILTGTANVIQTIYWQAAIVNDMIPMLLGTVYAWLVLRESVNEKLTLLLCAVLPCLSAGHHEAYGLLQTATIAMTVPFFFRYKSQFRRLVVGFIFSALGFLLVVIAPGNAVRQTMFPTPDIATAIQGAIMSAGIPEVISFEFSPLTCLALIILPALVAYYYDRYHVVESNQRLRVYMIAALLIIVSVSMAGFFVAYYATSNVLPSRTLIMVQYIILWGMAIAGYFAGLSLRSVQIHVFRPVVYGAVVLMIAGSVLAIGQGIGVMQQLKWYAQLWDQRDAEIRIYRTVHPGSTDPVMVTYIPDRFDILEASPDPADGVNQCIARYYDVAAIATYPPTP